MSVKNWTTIGFGSVNWCIAFSTAAWGLLSKRLIRKKVVGFGAILRWLLSSRTEAASLKPASGDFHQALIGQARW